MAAHQLPELSQWEVFYQRDGSPCKWRISWVSLETKPEATDRLLASPLSPLRVLDSSRSTSSLNTLPSLQTPSTSYTCSWQDVASKTKCEDYSRMFLIISKHIGGTYIFDWYQGKQWSFGALCEQCGVAILHGVGDVRATGSDNLMRSYLPAGTRPLRVNLHSQQQNRGHDIPYIRNLFSKCQWVITYLI